MELYEVLEKRRTYRDFSDREVSDEIVKRIIGAAFKAPTNDHLRQLEFIVVRDRENIAKVITPLVKNMEAFKELVFEVDDTDDEDKMAMFADALPKQQKMLMQSGLLILPFFRQKQSPLLKPVEQSSLNYFASAWCALENMLLAATNEGLGTVFHIPVSDEAEKIKEIVGAPEGYEFTCLLTMGYPAENAFLPKQKEINIEDRIHMNIWQHERMKGHILIMLANILFGASMPVFKYLLTADVPPEAITIMRAIFACMMFWLVSFFMPKEKVLPKDLCLLFVCALCGVGINQWLFVIGLKNSSPVNASIIATAVPIFVLLLAARSEERRA